MSTQERIPEVIINFNGSHNREMTTYTNQLSEITMIQAIKDLFPEIEKITIELRGKKDV